LIRPEEGGINGKGVTQGSAATIKGSSGWDMQQPKRKGPLKQNKPEEPGDPEKGEPGVYPGEVRENGQSQFV